MKTWLKALLCAVAVLASANLSSNAAEVAEPTIVGRGPHHAVWQRVTEQTTPYARKYYVTNSYEEVATGKHYQKEGQWLPSVEAITILPSGFGVATQLQHKVIFAPNINTAGAIDCVTPDEKRLRSHVLGLAYTDKRTGQGVMIASIKDSTGVLVSENQLLYPDAFDTEGGFRADIRYTVTLAGVEQDIILVESPPNPAIYGIDPSNCRLEIYSEFVDFAQPAKQTTVISGEPDANARNGMLQPDLVEEKLIFGVMRMGQGAAFRFGQADTSIPMGKTWEQREGRQLLIERADYTAIQAELARLPQVAKLDKPKKTMMVKGGGPLQASFLPKRPPNAHAAVKQLRTREMAQVSIPDKGFVLDWQLINANTNDFTFRGDTTYYVSAPVTFGGTTLFEAGTVIKGTNGNLSRRVWLQGPAVFRTSAYRPAIFTGKDDDTIGAIVTGSTGNPTTNYYGVLVDLTGNTNVIDIHDVRIRYAYYGIWCTATSGYELRDAQIGYTYAGVVGPPRFRNVLIYDGEYAVGGSTAGRGENVTFHRLNYLRSSGSIPLTNCLIIAVTNNVSYSGSNNQTNSEAGIFQTVKNGARYLVDNSPYRDSGTTNINASLLATLRQTTTYPPLVVTNTLGTTVRSDVTLTPQADRDTDTPDIGYHYPPIDWVVGGLSVTNAALRVSGGTTVAMDGNTNWGIRLDSGALLMSKGDPVYLNRFVRTHSVQEVPGASGTSSAPLFADKHPAPSSPAAISLRFTDVAQIQSDYAFKQVNQQGTLSSLVIQDSQFCGGTNWLSPNVTNQFIGITNVLFENAGLRFYPYTPTTLRIANCTFKAGFLGFECVFGSDWRVRDNIFDYTTFYQGGGGTVTNDYNGYLTNSARLTPNGGNDVVLATNTANFDTGALGSYYIPTTSAFIDKGSVTNAGFVGLWHYTTQTSQTKDAASRLDLGFHYVAVTNGIPIDSDGDGLADYIEDANGNGSNDSSESDWNVTDTDGDGVSDYVEWLQGRNINAGALLDSNNVINLRVFTPLK